MSPRERRLRERIDRLTDERDELRRELDRLRPLSKRGWVPITRTLVVRELKMIARREGRPPHSRDDQRVTRRAQIAFGSFSDAVVAAGFPRPIKGVRVEMRPLIEARR